MWSALSTQHSVISRLICYCKKLALLPFLLFACAATAQTTTFYFFDLTTPLNGYDMAISTDRQTTCNKAIVAFDATYGITSNLPPTTATVGEFIDSSTGLGWGAYYCSFEYSTTDPTYPRLSFRRDLQKRTCPDGQKLVQKFTTVQDYGYFSIYLVCENNLPTLLGFFNGVLNSSDDATASIDRLEAEFPSTTERPLIYARFLNQSGCTPDGLGGKIDCLQDFIELYDQLKERVEKRFDDWGAVVFSEIMNGSYVNPGSVTMKLISERKNESVRLALGQFADLIADKLQNSWWVNRLLKLVTKPPTVSDTAGHIATLKSYADTVKGMVFVAHSQGNFFANAAYAGMQGLTPPVKIEVVHIAPPTSSLIGNNYILSNTDSVINKGLRALGTSLRPSNIDLGILSLDPACFDTPVSPETPPCADLAYASVPRGDWSGHGFLGTYLNKAYNAYAQVIAMIDAAIERVRN
ncbi:MAG TPA: hypothetical protein PKC80_03205 [Burkholderiaceae bacterium]|nr:hypothetical protein [Burkholderiaceae bacterium]